MRCSKCGCHHPPFAPNEDPTFNPDCRCNCHQVQIIDSPYPIWRYIPNYTGDYPPVYWFYTVCQVG